MKIPSILFILFYLINNVFSSDEPELFDKETEEVVIFYELSLSANFPLTLLKKGCYYFKIKVFSNDQMTITTKTEKTKISTIGFFFSKEYPTDETLKNYKKYLSFDTEYTKTNAGHEQKYSFTTNDDTEYLAIKIVIQEEQNFVMISTSRFNIGIGLIILILFLPFICLSGFAVFSLKKYCDGLEGNKVNINEKRESDSSEPTASYTPLDK